MCGRYVLYDRLTNGNVKLLGHTIPANFNVAPTSTVPIIRRNAETQTQELIMARWGLVPRWEKSLKIPPFFNARADKLPGNNVFWPSINQRCLIPMAGFYEWSEQNKQPFYIYTIEASLTYAAGIWNSWQSQDGESIDSCAIITTQPNAILADIHHRMQVLLTQADQDSWLDDPFDQAKTLLKPYAQPMEKYPVNPKRVNNSRNNAIDCLDQWQA